MTESGLKNVQKVVQSIAQEELKSTQNTIQTEMKSYSAVVSNNCSAALSRRRSVARQSSLQPTVRTIVKIL